MGTELKAELMRVRAMVQKLRLPWAVNTLDKVAEELNDQEEEIDLLQTSLTDLKEQLEVLDPTIVDILDLEREEPIDLELVDPEE